MYLTGVFYFSVPRGLRLTASRKYHSLPWIPRFNQSRRSYKKKKKRKLVSCVGRACERRCISGRSFSPPETLLGENSSQDSEGNFCEKLLKRVSRRSTVLIMYPPLCDWVSYLEFACETSFLLGENVYHWLLLHHRFKLRARTQNRGDLHP